MSWFWLALSGSALWAVSNHIDKYLVEKFFRDRGVGALVIFSALIGLLAAPIVFFFHPEVVSEIGFKQFLIVANGAIFMVGIILYFYAMEAGEASVVAPLFQLIPVFLLGLGYLFLGETLTLQQLFGGLLIIGGAIAISMSMTRGAYRINRKVLAFMSLSSLLVAANFTFFKKFSLEESFWHAFFWGYVGVLSVGIICLVFVPSYRRIFLSTIKTEGVKVLSLNFLNETVDVGANMVFRYASLLAPLALVQMVNGFQPAFVFLYGILITIFFPKFGRESLAKEDLIRKGVSIAVMIIGAIIIGWQA